MNLIHFHWCWLGNHLWGCIDLRCADWVEIECEECAFLKGLKDKHD